MSCFASAHHSLLWSYFGGKSPISLFAESDASLQTTPKGRSAMVYFMRLSKDAGAIIVKAKSTISVVMSSFEAELDAARSAVKATCRLINTLYELALIP